MSKLTLNVNGEDRELDAIVASSVHDIKQQEICVKVRKVEQVASEVFKLIVQTPRTQRLRFLVGQYVELKKDQHTVGCMAIASCPCDDRNLQFHIPTRPENPLVAY